MTGPVVIVGAGQAGGRLFELLAQGGYGGSVDLLGDEPEAPYERPPLSKSVLLGTAQPTDAPVVTRPVPHPERYRQQRSARVTAIDRMGRQVTLDDGKRLGYATLVLATGLRPRELRVPGARLPGVYALRTAQDARALRGELEAPARRVVVVGAGFIGLEVAASASQRGHSVVVLEREPTCLARLLPAHAAERVAALHRSRGVAFRHGIVVERIEGDARAVAVRLATGERVPADVVVVGIGSIPNVELAADAGLAVADGICVDAQCRTADPHVQAIGDVAAAEHCWFGGRRRLESWENAERHAAIVAAGLLRREPPATKAPWFWTDQYDQNIQVLGSPGSAQERLVRAEARGGEIEAYLADGRLTGAVLLNSGRTRRVLEALVSRRAPLDRDRFIDATVDLKSLL